LPECNTNKRNDGHTGKARKYFFFEKKETKNFCSRSQRGQCEQHVLEMNKSFLVLFFKKELPSWRLPSCANHHMGQAGSMAI
jgi:hypothetical protein